MRPTIVKTRLEQTGLPARKILVVDNHPLIIKFMLDLLQKHGQEVVAASDAMAALRLLDDFQPDIIFIDLVMPKISGDLLCRIIRKRAGFENTHIIILSAIAAEDQTDFLAFGADACIAKGPLSCMAEHVLTALGEIGAERKTATGRIMGLENIFKRQATVELLTSLHRFESILAHITDGILEIAGDGVITYANPAAQEMLDLAEEKMLAANFNEVLAPEQRLLFSRVLRKVEESGMAERAAETPCLDIDKTLNLAFLPISEGASRSVLVIMRDVSKAVHLQKKLREASITDELTGLLNRRGFITLAEKQLRVAERGGGHLYLLFADFDNLKSINDTLGHIAGDQALAETADLLRNTFRKSDIMGRVGGDEFAVLLTELSHEEHQQSVLDRLEENTAKLGEKTRRYLISLSCGLAKFNPQKPCSLDELISRADQQMYLEKREKKKQGGSQYFRNR